MPDAQVSGLVADIQRFSLHDGPGIRTSVFLKGCNMNCAWCHNPETISPHPEYMLNPDKCIHCGQCAEGCYAGARIPVGKVMTPEDVLKVVLADRAYYGQDGGMTLTGGEPCLQPGFSAAILRLAKSAGIHCAMETNLSLPWKTVQPLALSSDMIMCDLKIWDNTLHRQYTGIGNIRILENLQALDALNVPILVRTPLIQGINDDDACIGSIARFLSSLRNLHAYELLPYHALGLSKIIEGKPQQQRFSRPDTEKIRALARLANNHVHTVRVSAEAVKEEQRST